jgi:hypothetical protein
MERTSRQPLQTLKANLSFNDRLLEFFDRVEWMQDKLEFLEGIYSKNMH